MKSHSLLKFLIFTLSICPLVGHAATALGHVVFIGDSITEGRYAAPGDTGPYSHGKYSWRYQFWKNAEDAGDSYNFVGSRTSNFGGSSVYPTYGGQSFPNRHEAIFGTSASERKGNLAAHYNDLNRDGSNYAADTALILIGSNDITSSSSATHMANTAGHVSDMIAGLRSANSTVDIYIVSVLPRYIRPSPESPYGTVPDSARNAKYLLFNVLLSDLAIASWTDASRVSYIDANSQVNATWFYDSIHPNETVGEVALGNMIYAAASTLGSPPPTVSPLVTSTYGESVQEDLEALTGAPFSSSMPQVSGQGGWLDIGSSTADRVRNDISDNFFNGNTLYSYNGGLEVYKQLGSQIVTTSPDGVLTLRFDLRTGTNFNARFGVGFYDSGMQLGIQFGCYGSNGWGITDALGVDHTSTTGMVTMLGARLELNIDLSNGTGSLRYDLNDGNGFIDVPELQDIDLKLNGIPESPANPTTWDTLYLSGPSPGDMMDNLSTNFTSQPLLKILGIGLTSPGVIDMEAVFLYTTQMYVLQNSTTMEPDSWTDVGADFQPSSHTAEAFATPELSGTAMFYRLRWVEAAP